MTITIHHRVERDDLALGLVRVEGIRVGAAPATLSEALDGWAARRRAQDLSAAEDALRRGSRDVLRNGRYKPTGRGKPASEYLLRAAREGEVPRINGPVDANNLVSLQHCVAVSVWDLDLAGTDRFELRLGAEEDRYVFNPAGQELELRDLVCGCGLLEAPEEARSTPMVTPIKDSMLTKIRDGTTRLAGCIYYPLQAGSTEHLLEITRELEAWLLSCGEHARGATAIATRGQTVEL